MISSSEMGQRESISLLLIIPPNEEVVELVGHHKFFHGLDHLQSLSLGLPLSSFSHVVLEETAIMCAAGSGQ